MWILITLKSDVRGGVESRVAGQMAGFHSRKHRHREIRWWAFLIRFFIDSVTIASDKTHHPL